MKKTLLLIAAMLATISSFAQTLTLVPTTAAKNDATLGFGQVGSAVALTLTATDVTGDIAYTVNGAGGTVAADGSSFTPSATGLSTITATAGALTATANVYAYDSNLAVGKLSSFSGEVSGMPATNAFDGNEGTRWASGTPVSADAPAYLITDLGAYFDINAVDLFFENANPADFTIQFSADGKTFSDGQTVTGLAGFQGGHYFYTSLTNNKQARYVKFNSTKPATDYGVSVYEMGIYGGNKTAIADNAAPTDFTVTAGEPTHNSVALTLKATDDVASTIKYSITDANHGISTTTSGASGSAVTYTLTGLSAATTYNLSVVASDGVNATDAQTVTFTTTAINVPAAPDPTVDADKVISFYSDKYTPAVTFNLADWGAATKYAEVELNGNKTLSFEGTTYYGMVLNANVDVTDAATLHMDIYSPDATSIGIVPIWQNAAGTAEGPEIRYTPTLVENQWNQLDIPMTEFANADHNNVIYQIKIDNGNGGTFYIDNIYLVKGAATPVAFSVTVANGVATVKGDVTTDNVAQINAADAMYIDLSGVSSIADGVSLKPLHANALIGVAGTHAASPAVAADKYAAIAGTKNMVVKDTWLFPVSQIQVVDDPANEPLWAGEGEDANIQFISTGTTGYKITRVLKAQCFNTIYLPATVTLPEGVTAWEATGYSDNVISFTKAAAVAAFFPYVVCNANAEATTIECEGTGDLSIITWATTNVAAHQIGTSSANIQGCMSTILTAATDSPAKYVLQDAAYDGAADANVTIKQGTGVTISPFRAFFTGITVAEAKASFSGITTGITSVKTVNDALKGTVYTISGQRVNAKNLTPGLYIVNGKKVVVK
jgi:hypothetical protein